MKDVQDKKQYGEYYELLKKKIIEKNLYTPSPFYGNINIIVSIFLYVFGLYLIGQVHIIVTIIYFYIISVELGYISHDLIHNQYFKNRKINEFFSYITANLLIGLSRSWWQKKHNIEHHTYTNSDIHDTDIRDYDEIFTKNTGKSPFFHKHKTILFWLSTSILYFNLVFLSYKYILENKKYPELILSLLNFGLVPYFLFINFGVGVTILTLIAIYILVGIHLAFVFMTNHIGMEVIDGNTIRDYAWFDLQTRTSRNITGGSIIHHIFGGLNKQIEHHLFPHIARDKIVAVAEETRRFCEEKGIQYHNVSFQETLREIYSTLKTGKTL